MRNCPKNAFNKIEDRRRNPSHSDLRKMSSENLAVTECSSVNVHFSVTVTNFL